MISEATHTSGAPFDAAMSLPEPVIQVDVRPMQNPCAEDCADGPRIGAVPIGCHPLWCEAHDRFCRAKEGVGRFHVAGGAEYGIDEVPVPIYRTIQVGPAAADPQAGFIDVPALAGLTAAAMPPLAQHVAHDGQQLGLPGADGLVADLDASQQKDLAQIPQGQPVAQAAEHYEGDDVALQAGPAQREVAGVSQFRSAKEVARNMTDPSSQGVACA
jgi:hypothetical protein